MVPPAPFSPVCGLGVPPVPLSIGSVLKLLPCDHDQGLLLSRDGCRQGCWQQAANVQH